MTTTDLGTLRTDDRPFTFLHAADLHLGASDHVQTAFGNLVKAALDHHVDAVMLAGDVYDTAERSPHLQLQFLHGLQRLDEAKILVFIAHGNHDPVADTFRPVVGEMPERVHVFQPGTPQTYALRAGGKTVTVTGVSFSTPHDETNLVELVAKAPRPAADLHVAVVHANLAGQVGHNPYAPCTLEDLQHGNVHYWALGHIHKAAKDSFGPGRWWAYPGNLQGRSLKPAECGPKGALVVRSGVQGFEEPEFVACDVHRFDRLQVNIAEVEHYADAVEQVQEAVNECRNGHQSDRIARTVTVRVQLVGSSQVHGQLDDLVSNAGALESNLLAVDRVEDLTRPTIDRAVVAQSDTLAGNVLRRLDALRDPGATADLEDLLSRTGSTMGQKAAARLKELDKLGRVDLAEVLDLAETMLLDELTGSDQ